MNVELDFQAACKHLKLELPTDKGGNYINDVQYYYAAVRGTNDLRDLWCRESSYYKNDFSLQDFIKFNKKHLGLFREYFFFKRRYIAIYEEPFFNLKCEMNNFGMINIYKNIMKWDIDYLNTSLEVVSSGISLEELYEETRKDILELSYKEFFPPTSPTYEDIRRDMYFIPFLRWIVSDHIYDMCADLKSVDVI